MIIYDINQHLIPPPNTTLTDVTAIGSFIRVTYQGKDDMVTCVYLNDFGREVVRCSWNIEPEFVPALVEEPESVPLGWWFTFRVGVRFITSAIKELLHVTRDRESEN